MLVFRTKNYKKFAAKSAKKQHKNVNKQWQNCKKEQQKKLSFFYKYSLNFSFFFVITPVKA